MRANDINSDARHTMRCEPTTLAKANGQQRCHHNIDIIAHTNSDAERKWFERTAIVSRYASLTFPLSRTSVLVAWAYKKGEPSFDGGVSVGAACGDPVGDTASAFASTAAAGCFRAAAGFLTPFSGIAAALNEAQSGLIRTGAKTRRFVFASEQPRVSIIRRRDLRK